ncbi:DNA (cytosine-5-)-methyltransferase [Vibrio sp. SCSIO 43155]|uniref:DNA cytosine methyltransferase n=1 Tax=Vibrio sp. SCSIO 43155 TaxID=2819099 RepID=UPI002075DFE8|nr:DNA (cytosine-5-)-methyltransferase [Vibrio sp. SCSIO 43155]USD58540.1 DNA (cytosine-5-)-methyltransferase [Vibrio sp. SCSIO 43155]
MGIINFPKTQSTRRLPFSGVTLVDLFAGGGGTTEGANKLGVRTLWAANHNPVAVETYKLNNPHTPDVVCQDLHQADFSLVPKHDLLWGSPCCQGHSNAAGAKKKTIKADISRSTAWAIISALEVHKSKIAIIENVSEFLEWKLYPAWELALKQLGYSISINILNACDFGVPQSRLRIFIVCTRTKHPIQIDFTKYYTSHVPASSFVDMNINDYKWDLVENKVANTRARIEQGRRDFGFVLLDAAYGSAKTGRSINKPLGSVLCANKHYLVIGDLIRPLSVSELAKAQSFDENYIWPKSKVKAKQLIGNAVPPLMAEKILEAVLTAA